MAISSVRSPSSLDNTMHFQEVAKVRKTSDLDYYARKLLDLTPRVIIVLLTGYYILGYAYAHGWMAAIDQTAIKVMRRYNMNYIAIGAIMPNFQWYAAWGVRITAGLAAGIAYDIMKRVTLYSQNVFAPPEAVRLPVTNCRKENYVNELITRSVLIH